MNAGFDRLLDLFIQGFHFFVPFFVLDEFERGVVMRFGRPLRDAGPGFHWCWPFFVDRIFKDNVVTRTHTLEPQALTTKDGRTVSVTAVVTANIADIRKALLEVESMDHALLDSCAAAIGAHVADTEWDELRKHSANESLTKACRQNTRRRYGIEIERVQLADLALCRVIRLHTATKSIIGS